MLTAMLTLAMMRSAHLRAHDITIYEDEYGVPSIVAANLPDAAFGLGYVEARDHAQRMAMNYKLARGRLAEINGRSNLLQDGFVRELGFESRAEDESKRMGPDDKTFVDAFLAGANKALGEQTGLPRWVEPFTEVDVLAFTQFVNAAFPLLDLSSKISPGAGSNQFALAPSRTATRHPILSADPHLGWDGQDGGIIWIEFAMYTPGAKFRGVAIPGEPGGVMGHNDHVAWSMTNNNPSLYTIYTVKTNPENSKQYSYHGAWKEYTQMPVELRYLDGGELKTSKTTARMTEWGPMIPLSNRTVRLATVDPLTTLHQTQKMLEAKNASEFRDALKMHGISMWNIVYADTLGTIGYQYNAAVPQRDPSFDWSKPVPGDDPKTAWYGLWSLDDLPNVQNPASGILVNCNSSPNQTTLGNELPSIMPNYVSSYGPTTRWEMLSHLLKDSKKVNPTQAMDFATDCTVPYAAAAVDQLNRFEDVGNAIDVLKKWDKKGKIDSVGCALYTYWLRQRRENPTLAERAGKGQAWTAEEGAAAKASLDASAQQMIAEQGSLTVPWGDIQYMQRGSEKKAVQGFGYVAQGPSLAAVSPASAGAATLKDGRSHATFGSSFRMIVSLEPKGIQSWSVLPYGNSGVPSSPHYADQMALYAIGKYKPTNFGQDNAKKHAVKSYHLQY